MSDQPQGLAAALAALQANLPHIGKDAAAIVPTKAGGTYGYKYADLSTITRILMPKLADLSQRVERSGDHDHQRGATPPPQPGAASMSTANELASKRGDAWERRAARWVATNTTYSHAEHVGKFRHPHAGDILNIGDRVVECTVKPFAHLADKMRQAEGDARISEFDEFWVWKTARGLPLGESYMVTRARVMWGMAARLDKLDAWEAEHSDSVDEAFARGFRAGQREATA